MQGRSEVIAFMKRSIGRVSGLRATAAIVIAAGTIAGCQAVMPEKEDIENAVMKSLTADVKKNVDRAEIASSNCRASGNSNDEAHICDVTYELVFRPGASVEGPKTGSKTIELYRYAGRWVLRQPAVK
jgi:hypothetical protein